MIKSFYHMTHKHGKFNGDFLYSDSIGVFKKDQEYVVVSGQSSSGTIEPFFEGFYRVTRVEAGNWEFQGKAFSYRASITPERVPASSSVNISAYKERSPNFKNRYQNQFSVEVSSEELEFFESLVKTDNQKIKKDQRNANDEKDIATILGGDTEKASEVMARLGQGTFRKNVSRIWGNKAEVCALSLVNFPALLTASHIVPWKDCKGEREHWRLDGANGILLCAHYDRLFDRHLITFDVRGLSCPIRVSKLISDDLKQTLRLDDSFEVTPNQMKEEDLVRFKKYLEIHNRTFADLEASR